MRFTILLCVAGLWAAGPVFGEARDTLRLKIAPPRVMVPETVVLTDSIPGAFIEKLDALYEMWYVTKHGGEGDGGGAGGKEGGQWGHRDGDMDGGGDMDGVGQGQDGDMDGRVDGMGHG